MKKFKSVDEYLSDLPKEQRAALEKLRKLIKSVAPKAEETISYGMPAFKLNGPLVYYAGFKNHLSLFPASKKVIDTFSKELKDYKTSAGTIQFTLDNPLPDSLVKKIVKLRMIENSARKSGYGK